MTTSLAYTLDGPRDAPVLVLGNSLGTDRGMWAPQLPALREHFRVLGYDQLGHGGSGVPAGPYTVEGLGTELLALCDELGVRSFHYAGLSLGGMIGLWLGVHATSRVDSLTLMCTSAHLGRSAGFADRAAAVRRDGLASIVDAVLGRWFTTDFAATEPTAVARVRAMLLGTPDEGYAACCEAIDTHDERGGLAGITAPTLVIGGEHDPSIPPAHQRAIAEGIPGARLAILPAAHLANVQCADEVTGLLLAHLEVR